MVALLLALLAASPVHAGRVKIQDSQMIVIEANGKVCVSSVKTDIGFGYVGCDAKDDGTCPSAQQCGDRPEIQPRVGIVTPGEYKPGKKPSVPPTGGGPTNGGAAF